MDVFYNWLYYLVTLTLIISILFYFFNRRRLASYFRYLAAFLTMHLVLDAIGYQMSKAGIPNLPLLHFYTLLEFVFLGLFYKNILHNSKALQRNFLYLLPLGALLIIGNSLFVQNVFEFNNYAKTFSNISIILFALLYFYTAVLGRIDGDYRQSLNLINTAFFIYYMGTLMVFLFSDFLRRNDQGALFEIWKVNLFLMVLLQFLLLIGLLLARRVKAKG